MRTTMKSSGSYCDSYFFASESFEDEFKDPLKGSEDFCLVDLRPSSATLGLYDL